MVKTEDIFRLARVLQGKRQRDIARKVSITHSALSSYEAGRYTLSLSTLHQIAPLLNINPDFVTGKSKNPFKSEKLIKMFFNEQMHKYIIIEPINVLTGCNQKLEFISLVANIDLITKVKNLSLFQKPIYAIAVRDGDNNIFLLRRKIKTAYIKLDGAFYLEVWPILEIFGDEKIKGATYFAEKEINKDLYRKIKDWAVERKDIEPLFDECLFRVPLSLV